MLYSIFRRKQDRFHKRLSRSSLSFLTSPPTGSKESLGREGDSHFRFSLDFAVLSLNWRRAGRRPGRVFLEDRVADSGFLLCNFDLHNDSSQESETLSISSALSPTVLSP